MQDRILSKASELIYRLGLRAFTMDDIAKELGISKKTLYKYFSSKNQLIGEIVSCVVAHEKRTLDERLAFCSSWLEKLEAMLTLYTPEDIPFQWIETLYRYFPEEKKKIEELSEYRQRIMLPLIEEGQKTGMIRTDLRPEIILIVINNIFISPANQPAFGLEDITVNQILEQLKKLLFHGILEKSGGIQ